MPVARRSWHLAKAGQGNCGEEALAGGLVYLSLMRYLGCTYALFSHVKNADTLFTPAKLTSAKI